MNLTAQAQMIAQHTVMGYQDGINGDGKKTAKELREAHNTYVAWVKDSSRQIEEGCQYKPLRGLLQDVGYFTGKAKALKAEALKRKYKVTDYSSL